MTDRTPTPRTTRKAPEALKALPHEGRNLRLVVYLSTEELDLVDRDLGGQTRSEYARAAILAAAWGETVAAKPLADRARAAIDELERRAVGS